MKPWKKEDSTYTSGAGKTESFLTRNAKLIAFLCTVGVFLALFGPLLVMGAREYQGLGKDTRPQMTLGDIVRLSEQKPLYAEQLTKFACEENVAEEQNTLVILIGIDGGRYMVAATADTRTGIVIKCLMRDMDGDETAQWDVLEDDLRAIFGN